MSNYKEIDNIQIPVELREIKLGDLIEIMGGEKYNTIRTLKKAKAIPDYITPENIEENKDFVIKPPEGFEDGIEIHAKIGNLVNFSKRANIQNDLIKIATEKIKEYNPNLVEKFAKEYVPNRILEGPSFSDKAIESISTLGSKAIKPITYNLYNLINEDFAKKSEDIGKKIIEKTGVEYVESKWKDLGKKGFEAIRSIPKVGEEIIPNPEYSAEMFKFFNPYSMVVRPVVSTLTEPSPIDVATLVPAGVISKSAIGTAGKLAEKTKTSLTQIGEKALDSYMKNMAVIDKPEIQATILSKYGVPGAKELAPKSALPIIEEMAKDNLEKQFKINEFLKSKGINIKSNDYGEALLNYFRGIPDERAKYILKKYSASGKITSEDINKLTRELNDEFVSNISQTTPNEIKEMAKNAGKIVTDEEAQKIAKEININALKYNENLGLSDFSKKKILNIEEPNIKKSIEKELNTIKTESYLQFKKRNIEEIIPKTAKISKEENTVLKNPEIIKSEFINNSLKSVRQGFTGESISQLNKKMPKTINEKIKKLEYALFDQNINVLKYAPLYRFWNERTKIYWKTYNAYMEVYELVKDLNPKEYAYMNYRIFYNALLEETERGNLYVFKNSTEVRNAFNKIREEFIKNNPSIDINKLDEFIDNTVAKKMSEKGLELLRESPFYTEEFAKAVYDKKYYFSFTPPEELNKFIKPDVFEFTKAADIDEEIFTPFLKARVGSSIIPEDNVMKAFYKGLLYKVYSTEKYKMISRIQKEFGITEDEIKNGVKDAMRAEKLSDALAIPKEEIMSGIKNENMLKLQQVNLPVLENVNGHIIIKKTKTYLPEEIVSFLKNKQNTFSETIVGEAYNNLSIVINKFITSSFLELNPSYFGFKMFLRDVFDMFLLNPGSTFNFSKKITNTIKKIFNIEYNKFDDELRPLVDFDAIKTLFKIKYKDIFSKDYSKETIKLGELGAFSGKPIPDFISQKTTLLDRIIGHLDIKENMLDTIKTNVVNGSAIKIPFEIIKTIYSNIALVGSGFMVNWDTAGKGYGALRLIAKENKISKLDEKEFLKLAEKEIEKKQEILYEYAAKKFKTTPLGTVKQMTIEFEKTGEFIQKLKGFTYFLNPQMQSYKNHYFVMKADPLTYSLRLSMLISSSIIANYELFEWDKENIKKYGDKYISLVYKDPEYISKDLQIKLGTAELENGFIVPLTLSIPLGEIGGIFNSYFYINTLVANLTDSYNDGFKKSIQNMYNKKKAQTIFRNISPSVSATVTIPLELMTGKMIGRGELGKNIVPENLQNLEPKSQYDRFTDPTYIMLGEKFGISPKKLQYYSGYYGFGKNLIENLSEKESEKYKQEPIGKFKSGLRAILPIYSTSLREKESVINNIIENEMAENKELKHNLSELNKAKNLIKSLIFNKMTGNTEYEAKNIEHLNNLINQNINNPEFNEINSYIKSIEKSYDINSIINSMPNTLKMDKELINDIINITKEKYSYLTKK